MVEAEKSLLARVAWLYYIQGLTQEQVGARLQFSRTKITRLLAHARDEGIVEININNQYLHRKIPAGLRSQHPR